MAEAKELPLDKKAENTKIEKIPAGAEGMVKVIDRKLNAAGDDFIVTERWISQFLADTQMTLPKEQRMPAFRNFVLA
jgi:hypothetical protein